MSGARVGYLGLGSNVGERRANLQAARDGLPPRGVAVLASSSTYDTDPVGEILDHRHGDPHGGEDAEVEGTAQRVLPGPPGVGTRLLRHSPGRACSSCRPAGRRA